MAIPVAMMGLDSVGSDVNAEGEARESAGETADPAQQRFHDILLIREEISAERGGRRLERFAVDKELGHYREAGAVKAPVDPNDEGYRSTMNLGVFGGRSADDPERGPALSTLPLHPNPAASSATTCYLVNPENLNYTTAWTADEWNASPGGYDAPGRIGEDSFSLLIATPAGKVYYIEKKESTSSVLFEQVDLQAEAEIWAQLRSGCVVGRALYEGAPGRSETRAKVIPLINVESLSLYSRDADATRGKA